MLLGVRKWEVDGVVEGVFSYPFPQLNINLKNIYVFEASQVLRPTNKPTDGHEGSQGSEREFVCVCLGVREREQERERERERD